MRPWAVYVAPRQLTASELAFAYELRHEYGMTYAAIAKEMKVDRSVLNLAILRCEREGIAWLDKRKKEKRK